MISLRPYQTTARYGLNALINARRHPVFVSPTGTGKTETAVQTIADRVSLGYRSFVLTPQIEIFNQWLTAFSRAGISAGTITDKGIRGRGRAVYVVMPLSLVNLLPYLPEKFAPDEIWTDEAHHSQASSWARIYQHYENASRIGLTATPYRMDNKPLGDYYTDIVQTITMKEAITAGYLAEPLIIAPQKYADRVQLPDGDISPEEQAEILGKAQIIGDVIKQYSETFAGLPVIAACCTHVHAQEVTEQFRAAGWQWAHIHSGLSQYDREKILRDIKARRLNGICTVGIGIEGMDIPGLYGLIWLRRTLSLTIYLQFCIDSETEILTEVGWKNINSISYNDRAAAFDTETEEIKYRPVLNIVKRPLHNEECFYSIKNDHLDIRVTNNHDMLTACGKKTTCWIKETAEKTSKRKGLYRVPVCGDLKIKDNEKITDSELLLLGWFLSDGTRNKKNNAITISQSYKHKHYINEIEEIIIQCGFKYGKYRIKRTGNFSKYEDLCAFTISYGAPKGKNKHLEGYGRLEEWFNKSIPDIYNTLSSRQLKILLKTLFDGDGFKRKRTGYTSRTTTITCGDNYQMASRIQELCILRGISCKIHSLKTPTGVNHNLAIKYEYRTRSIPGVNITDNRIKIKNINRARFLKETTDSTGEIVWCIENDIGTIVTRRGGKVTIMGNCGRVLRPLPGKKYGIIIDAVGNTFIHGRPERDRAWSLTTDYEPPMESAAPTMKLCPVCGVMNSIGNECCHICGCNIAEERAAMRAEGGRGFPAVVDGELVMLTEGERAARAAEVESHLSQMRAEQARRQEQAGGQSAAHVLPISRADKINILRQGITGKRGTLFESMKGYI